MKTTILAAAALVALATIPAAAAGIDPALTPDWNKLAQEMRDAGAKPPERSCYPATKRCQFLTMITQGPITVGLYEIYDMNGVWIERQVCSADNRNVSGTRACWEWDRERPWTEMFGTATQTWEIISQDPTPSPGLRQKFLAVLAKGH